MKPRKTKPKPWSDAIRKAIRKTVGPGKKIVIRTPQFTRPKNEPEPAPPPANKKAFDALKRLSDAALKEVGMREWGRKHDSGHESTDTGPMLWLYPGEWYSAIPEGYSIVNLNFEEKTFERGFTSKDIRFGLLSFGFVKE